MNLPDSFIHQSFRYVLGRQTYAVSEWCDWCVKNWADIPESEKNLIRRELEEAFVQHAKGFNWKPLGDDMDVRQWERVRALW